MMAPAQRRDGTLTTAGGGRPGVLWALLAALLIVMGLGAPGPASLRPQAEYSQRIQTAATPDRAAVAVASAAAVLRPHAPASARAAVRPPYGSAASSEHRGLPRHAYQAIGPPKTAPSQPA